jgi:hypothetical protein
MAGLRARRSPPARSLIVLAALAAGCIAGPPGPATPSPPVIPVASPSDQPGPSATIVPAVSGSPVLPSAPPSATPRPSGIPADAEELQARLPRWAAGSSLDVRLIEVDDFGSDPRNPLRALVDELGVSPEAFRGALASGDKVQFFDMRVGSVPPAQVAAAFAAASRKVFSGATSSSRTSNGLTIERIRIHDAAGDADFHVFVIDAMPFVAIAEPDLQPEVDTVIGWMTRPALTRIFPATLGGKPVTAYAIQGAAVGTGGDVCFLVCPGEPQALAKALGVGIDQVDLAVGGAADGILAFTAFRIVDAGEPDLVAARIASVDGASAAQPTRLEIGGKAVAVYASSPLPGQAQYLYAHDNILVIVRVWKSDAAQAVVDAEMEELFAALP